MPLAKPRQQLSHDSKVSPVNDRRVDALALIMLITKLYAGDDRLAAYADEIKAGTISRTVK